MAYDELIKQLIAVGIAMVGGVVSVLNAKETKITLGIALKRTITSGFAGLMMSLLVHDINTGIIASEYIKYSLVGMSGYSGVYTLKFLESLYKNIIERTKK